MLFLLLHFIGEVGSPHLPSPTSVCSVFLYTCLAVIEEIYIYIYRERVREREREGRGTEVGVGWGLGRWGGGGIGAGTRPGLGGGGGDFCGDCHYASAISNCFGSCDVTYVARYSTEPEPIQIGIHLLLKQWLTDVGLRTPPLLRSPTPTSNLLNVQLGVFSLPSFLVLLYAHEVPTIFPYALRSY